jgi:glycosyltransferase involved in cell wall biosynthesis
MSDRFRPCVLIPTYDNPVTIEDVVLRTRAHLPDVLVVDDGSGAEGRRVVARLALDGLATVLRRERNGGKGAAVRDGLVFARELGYTHAVQVDADGQHDLDDIPLFLRVAREHPRAFVTGTPVFDETVPLGRRVARLVSRFWVSLETGGAAITDPLCGLRVYPVAAALAARPLARHMGHDPEIAVRLCWAGVPVINLPTRVRYLRPEDGGVSHYRLFRDTLEMTWVHTLLVNQAACRLVRSWTRRRRPDSHC